MPDGQVQRSAEDGKDEWVLIKPAREKTGGASKVARCHVMLGQARGQCSMVNGQTDEPPIHESTLRVIGEHSEVGNERNFTE